jgi:hypothetical protein
VENNIARLTGWSGGGGFYIRNSPATISGNTIRDNISSSTGEGNGGGILVQGNGPTLIDGNTIESNIAGTAYDSAGGGVCLFYSDAILTGNIFEGNIASTAGSGFGGGMYTSNSPAVIDGNTFLSNTASIGADGHGGGLMLSLNSPATVTNNIFQDNTGSTVSRAYGGGIRVWGSPALIQGNTIYNNVASTVSWGYGGGISVYNSPATLTSNTVTGNAASSTGDGSGGGISLNSGSPSLNRNHLVGNSAYAGGGLHLCGSDATLTDNFVLDNTASGQGGGVYVNGLSPLLINTVVADNALSQASATGAGVCVVIASPRLVHSTIARNTGGDGSGVYVTGFEWEGTYYSSTVWLTNTVLVSHTLGITVSAGDVAHLNNTLWHANGNDWDGEGTINHLGDHSGDPAFAADGYHLTGVSGAINKGIEAGVTTDIDGEVRPQGLGYDLGADEWICASGLTGVGISGPAAGYTGTPYACHAVIAPPDASEPIAYTWLPEPASGQGTPTAVYQWDTAGTYTVTLDAKNCGGVASDMTHMIVISSGAFAQVDPEVGGTLVYTDTEGNATLIEVPGSSVTDTITLVYTPLETVTAPPGFLFAGHAFDLEAYRDGALLSGLAFDLPVTVTIQYSDADVVGLDPASLLLERWTGSTWEDAACGPYDRHPEENWLAVPVCHLSRFALFGEPAEVRHSVYLPLVVRNH